MMLRFHQLVHVAESPLAYQWWRTHDRPDSASMRIGRAVHALALCGTQPVVYECVRRGRDWEAFRAGHPGVELLSPAEGYSMRECCAAIARHDAARLLLARGMAELEIDWVERGRPCGGRVDMVNDGILVELKTAREVAPRRFAAQAEDLHYVHQLAWYRRGLRALGHEIESCAIVAAQSVPPWDVVCYSVSESDLASAEREIYGWLDLLERCEASGEWPGCEQNVVELVRPAWAGGEADWEVDE
jgi:hypothetical protein